MGNVGSLEHHGLRSKFVQIGRVNFPASVASDRVRSLLIRQKEDQLVSREFCCCAAMELSGHRTKSALGHALR